MNPTAGSFNITPRMQRHFATFAVQMPPADIVRSIYLQILDGHLTTGGFEPDVARLGSKLVDATIELHRMVSIMCACHMTVPMFLWGLLLGLACAGPVVPEEVCCFSLVVGILRVVSRKVGKHTPAWVFKGILTPISMCLSTRQVMHNFLPSAVKFHYQVGARTLLRPMLHTKQRTKQHRSTPRSPG